MSKLYRKSLAPAGALLEVQNVRLYGSHEEQISTAALRARGCPSPERAYVPGKSRDALRREREVQDHRRRLQRAQTAMLDAVRAVERAKRLGQDRTELAATARDLRAAYLRMSGAVERRTIEPRASVA